MLDWHIFVLGLAALSIVIAAVRAISREDLAARQADSDARSPKQPAP